MNLINNIIIKGEMNRICQNFEKECRRICKNKKAMVISKMLWRYDYFNVAYLNNALSLILYALYKGCVPIIEVNTDSNEYCKWDWYFEQPYKIVCKHAGISEKEFNGFKKIQCDKTKSFSPEITLVYHPHDKEFEQWKFLFKKFVVLNQETLKYYKEDAKKVLNQEPIIGCLLRGTDYTALKPKYHPIQPDVEEVLDKISNYMEEYGYSKIYVATEEKRLFDLVCDRFGKKNVYSNNRTYYDEKYFSMENDMVIGNVHFERENDNYFKGVEYLSSLVILSHCHALVAGGCGGTQFAMMYSNSFEHVYIFDKGLY